ncbi:hypothetical protein A2215_00485 [Candidatus Berkelbacteria bacterium RIFOXYA2_FULL_43_10]|uniref:GxxExxY protein n=1 Tax=Candidatus Berkelbacteria bacterium RIFOXYA2_FULL_43_10 TaxID=1797472 RepID=A0A1F5E3W4_9BACT|nr:MAG: hypothetical protein A2215_00485 [Candidatus Berkelbacteria bacterium RIFOXYA2_FULL_43_10]
MMDLIYEKESYAIIGCCFEVYNKLCPGLKEKNYQVALEKVFQKKNIPFKSQLYVPLKIDNEIIGKYYLDFLVYDIIALEIKTGKHFHRKDIEQIYAYLKSKRLKLGLLINFTNSGVQHKRIVNLK